MPDPAEDTSHEEIGRMRIAPKEPDMPMTRAEAISYLEATSRKYTSIDGGHVLLEFPAERWEQLLTALRSPAGATAEVWIAKSGTGANFPVAWLAEGKTLADLDAAGYRPETADETRERLERAKIDQARSVSPAGEEELQAVAMELIGRFHINGLPVGGTEYMEAMMNDTTAILRKLTTPAEPSEPNRDLPSAAEAYDLLKQHPKGLATSPPEAAAGKESAKWRVRAPWEIAEESRLFELVRQGFMTCAANYGPDRHAVIVQFQNLKDAQELHRLLLTLPAPAEQAEGEPYPSALKQAMDKAYSRKQEVSSLRAEIERLKGEQILWQQALDKFMEGALVAIAGAVCTPEKGYAVDGGPSQLLADLKDLRAKYNKLRKLADAVKAFADGEDSREQFYWKEVSKCLKELDAK